MINGWILAASRWNCLISSVCLLPSSSAPIWRASGVRLNFPYRSVLDIFAYQQSLMIMPTETESGGFNPQRETRGPGP